MRKKGLCAFLSVLRGELFIGRIALLQKIIKCQHVRSSCEKRHGRAVRFQAAAAHSAEVKSGNKNSIARSLENCLVDKFNTIDLSKFPSCYFFSVLILNYFYLIITNYILYFHVLTN